MGKYENKATAILVILQGATLFIGSVAGVDFDKVIIAFLCLTVVRHEIKLHLLAEHNE